jgi:hypothetical protein
VCDKDQTLDKFNKGCWACGLVPGALKKHQKTSLKTPKNVNLKHRKGFISSLDKKWIWFWGAVKKYRKTSI